MADLKVHGGSGRFEETMHVKSRLSLLPGLLLLAAPAFALAESPMPDPIAPAVIGRPLDKIRPWHATAKPVKPVKPAKPKQATARAPGPAKSAKAVRPSPALQATAMGAAPTAHAAKQALDDRVDPHAQLGEVGKGTHFARKPLGPGAYFADRHREAVRKYYAEHPLSRGAAAKWTIGEPVPNGATLAAVPHGLLASLPKVPPGHRYAQLGGEVVLIASGSKMVVDGISRNPH